MTLENASEKLGISKERLYKRCEAGRIYGVIPYSADMNEKSYLIPTSYVKKGR